jgi:hypothetical protein
MSKRPTIDQTDQGAQRVLPGAERINARELARHRMAAPLRATAPQRAADHGLFGSDQLQRPLPFGRQGGDRR